MLATILATVLLRQTTTYTPAQTRVLVVPPIDASGDKQATVSTAELAEIKTTTEGRFAGRGFVVVTDADATTAVSASGVDLTVAANRTIDNLYKIGAAANTQLVVFTTIDKTGQKMKQKFMDSHMEGYATLQTWLVDVPNKRAIILGEKKSADAQTVSKTEPNRQVRAVNLAIVETLHPFIKQYAEIKK